MQSFLAAALGLFWADRTAVAAPQGVWSRSLAEIGYEQPITADGLDGELGFAWTVPEPARRGQGRISLRLDTVLTAGFAGVISAKVNGRPLASRALAEGRAALPLDLTLDPDMLASGQLLLQLRFAAAASADSCRDARLGGVSLAVDPGSALLVRLPDGPRDANDARALLPATLALSLPGIATGNDYKRAVLATAALIADGHRIRLTAPEAADVRLDPSAGAARLEGGSLVLPMAGAPRRPSDAAADSIPLGAIAGASGLREANPGAGWAFTLPREALPHGKIPAALRLFFTAEAEKAAAPRIVNLFVNGALAASQELRSAGTAEALTLLIPPGLTRLGNALSIRLARAGGCAQTQSPLAIALDPRSRLELADVPTGSGEFLDAARAAQNGLTVYLRQGALADIPASLPLLAGLLAAYGITDEASLDVVPDGAAPPAPRRAFILMGGAPPPDAQTALRNGAAMLENSDGRRVAALDPALGGFAALIVKDGQPGIWLSPPRDHPRVPAPAGLLALEHGDLALIDDRGLVLWTNTRAPHGLSVRYADTVGLGLSFLRAWPFGVTLMWIGLSLAVLIVLARQALHK